MSLWYNAKLKEPEDNEMCNIYIDRGIACDVIILNICYKKNGGWLDILDSEEAGAIYSRDDVTAWCNVDTNKIVIEYQTEG